jgi:CBS domain-containing protein
MVKSPITVRPGSSILDVAGLMAEKKIGCVPVTDESNRLVGFLSAIDLLRHFAQQASDQ